MLQGTGKGHVGSLPAPAACEAVMGDVQWVMATQPDINLEPFALEGGK